jgi:hypothetical protein
MDHQHGTSFPHLSGCSEEDDNADELYKNIETARCPIRAKEGWSGNKT